MIVRKAEADIAATALTAVAERLRLHDKEEQASALEKVAAALRSGIVSITVGSA
jgi:hypothetical protein